MLKPVMPAQAGIQQKRNSAQQTTPAFDLPPHVRRREKSISVGAFGEHCLSPTGELRSPDWD
jgi:hypothetical protein